jgi:hypothetical protein
MTQPIQVMPFEIAEVDPAGTPGILRIEQFAHPAHLRNLPGQVRLIHLRVI